MKYKILIAEDEDDIVSVLKLYLEGNDYDVFCADNGYEAFDIIQKFKIDLAILDVKMPGIDGYALTQKIRGVSNIPIIILSARAQDNDKILGLNIGADDYMAKPFNPIEVVARVRSNLRRFYELGCGNAQAHHMKLIRVGELCLNLDEHILTKNGNAIILTPTEYKIIAKLMKSPGHVFAKAQLYESINGEFFQSDDSTMMVHISKLREKLEDDPKNPKYIKTIRGIGYKLDAQN